MNTFNISYILFLSASLLVSCSHKSTVNEGFPAVGDTEKLTLICSSINCQYAYLVYLNGEPVAGGTCTGIYGTQVYPLRDGTNKVLVELRFPPNQSKSEDEFYAKAKRTYLLSLSTKLNQQSVPWIWKDSMITERYYDSQFTNTTWESVCVATNARVPLFEFDKLPSNKSEMEKECCDMARKIAQMMQARDKERLKRAFSISESDFQASHAELMSPGWKSGEPLAPDANIMAVSGECFVLVLRGKDRLVEVGKSFVSFSDSKSDSVVQFDQFLFAKKNGQWILKGLDDKWWKLVTAEFGAEN